MNDRVQLQFDAVHLKEPLHRHAAFYRDARNGHADGGWDITLDPATLMAVVEKGGKHHMVPSGNVKGYDVTRIGPSAQVPNTTNPKGVEMADSWLNSGKKDDPKLRERQAVAHRFKSETEVERLDPIPGATWEEAESGQSATAGAASPSPSPSATPATSSAAASSKSPAKPTRKRKSRKRSK